jgi:hypothetical protein
LVLFGVPRLYRTVKLRGSDHLRLDRTGFEVWNGQWNSLKRGSWDEVEEILDHQTNGRKSFNEVIVFVPTKGPSAMLYADAITSDSRALREWVRFYWEHPEYRDELLDDRGLQRLSADRFTVE